MSCCEEPFEQLNVRNVNAEESRLSLSQEASCCRVPSCPRQPVNYEFRGPNGDLQIIDSGAPIAQRCSLNEASNLSWSGRHPYALGYGRSNFSHYKPNIAHVIGDAITQRHSGYYQPQGYGWGNYGHPRQNIAHVIGDVITQRHSGYYQPSMHGIGLGIRHRFGHNRFR